MYRFIQKTVLAIAAVVAAGFIGANAQQVIKVDNAKLPVEAKAFIKQHFSNTTIAKYEKKFWSNSYEIELSDGTDIDFDSKGKCTGVEAPGRTVLAQSLVTSMLPNAAVKTLADKNLMDSIEEIEYNPSKGYKVDVRHDTIDDYLFTASGELIKIEYDD